MLQPLNILTLLFIISWGCGAVLGATQQIDNTSPQIQYQGAWSMSNTPGDGDFGDTLASSQDNSDTAKLQFSGTSVTVFGALKPVGTWNMHSAYYLDDSPAVGFIPNPLVASEQHQVKFYSSGPLSDGPHTLTIVNMGQQFWFDFIAVETSASTTTTTKKTATVPNLHPGTPTLPTPIPPTTSSTSSVQITSSVLPPSTITSTSSSIISRSSSTRTSSSSATPTTSAAPSNSTETTSSPTGSPASSSTPTQSSLTPTSDPGTSNGIATLSFSSISTSSTSTTPTSTGTNGGHTLPLGEIIGIAAGGAAFILALALTFFALWRRRRRIAARAAISPFVSDAEADSEGTPSPPPDYWPSEKSSAIDRARLSLPVRPPARQMLVITHGDHAGGMWADYQSSMPTASGYHASESSLDGDLKALRADLARRAKRPAAVCVAPESRGVPF